MNIENLTENELTERFENFLFSTDDYIETLQSKAVSNGFCLDMSLNSLNTLEKYIIENNISVDSDEYNDCSTYLGEVVRIEFQGEWICNLDREHNSLYYGFPVIIKHAPNNVLFSPFHVVKAFILRKKENLFVNAIKSQVNPVKINWNKFPDKNYKII